MSVNVGAVETWDTGCTVREQALKVLEEAAEAFAAARNYAEFRSHLPEGAGNQRMHVLAECADVITATCNLLSMLGVEDATEIMADCARRQRERGGL